MLVSQGLKPDKWCDMEYEQRIDNPSLDIQHKREALGLSYTEFAALIDLKSNGERTIRGWENGEHKPFPNKLKKINGLSVNAPFGVLAGQEKFRFIDLFAGIGGIRLPFQELGGKCVFTSEWDKFAQKTYAANFGEMPQGDITQIASEDIPDHDVLLAGFPCQTFSQAGLKKGFNDTRGTMFFEIQRILVAKRPKMFLLENVKQLRGHDKGRTLRTILDILEGKHEQEIPNDVPLSKDARAALSQKLNYKVEMRVLRAADFGIPQNRERVFIVGFDRDYFKDGIDTGNFFEWCKPTLVPTRVGSILENNNELLYREDTYTISDKLWAGHQKRKAEHKIKGNGFGYSLVKKDTAYTNTISARYYKDGSEILVDQSYLNKNPRKLTPRECARLQGFPENFIVDAVSQGQIYKQFGNSVCVSVVRAVAQQMIKSLQNNVL
jgi:DNA (cytosine-5)-methyltransferase 1